MDARLCGSRRSFRCAALAARRRAPQSKRRQPNELLHGVPECAGSRALAAGLQALAAGRKHRAAALFLRAERVAQDQALRAAARRSVDTAAIEVPSPARREGSLLMREVAQGGRASAARAFEEVGAPAADATGRFEPWLVGGEVPRVDCQTPEGFQRALGYVARRVPVVMLNLDLMPASKRWDVEYLRSHTNEWPGMNVLRSGGENRYLYYVPEQADRDMSAFQHAPRRASADLRLSFENFLAAAQQDPQGRYYLQAPLVLRQADGRGLRETWSPGIGAELRADCESRVDRRRLEQLQDGAADGCHSASDMEEPPAEFLQDISKWTSGGPSEDVSDEEIQWMLSRRPLTAVTVQQLAHDYGEAEAQAMWKALAACGLERLRPTLRWPGVGTRWRRFVRWAQEMDPAPDTPEKALAGFARALGRVTTYRALSLDALGLRRIVEAQEIFPRGQLEVSPERLTQVVEEHGVAKVVVARLYIAHLKRLIGYDPSVSLHDDWQTTSCIASGYTGSDKKVHLFEVSVPVVESCGLRLSEVEVYAPPLLGPRYGPSKEGWFCFQAPAFPAGVYFDRTVQRTERYGLYSVPFLPQRLLRMWRFPSAAAVGEAIAAFAQRQEEMQRRCPQAWSLPETETSNAQCLVQPPEALASGRARSCLWGLAKAAVLSLDGAARKERSKGGLAQVAGEKRFLLFDPGAAEGRGAERLYPFPVAHPYDEYSMVDLEHIDSRSFPKTAMLQKRGAVACLRENEALFVPTHWWHHVQGVAPSSHAWSISVNFWFAIHRVLLEGPHPFPPHLELELARHLELLLSDVGGSASVGSLARDLLQDSQEEFAQDEAFLPLRNFVLDRLATLLGPENVAAFLSQHFPPERFQRSVVARALGEQKRSAAEPRPE
ncbi:unnamed protein product [Effrenium voratum]|uniref:Cupin-like domain-containing protein n=1 Tax=Effrenium voratum TaxID=2562239 RepID=A0AA36JLN0_9DINO|nr:unnamed protein product [Effrenium voratum]